MARTKKNLSLHSSKTNSRLEEKNTLQAILMGIKEVKCCRQKTRGVVDAIKKKDRYWKRFQAKVTYKWKFSFLIIQRPTHWEVFLTLQFLGGRVGIYASRFIKTTNPSETILLLLIINSKQISFPISPSSTFHKINQHTFHKYIVFLFIGRLKQCRESLAGAENGVYNMSV